MILDWEYQVTGPGYTDILRYLRVRISGQITLQSDDGLGTKWSSSVTLAIFSHSSPFSKLKIVGLANNPQRLFNDQNCIVMTVRSKYLTVHSQGA